eukprot:5162233-Prorocentrum_lima.AAC.1
MLIKWHTGRKDWWRSPGNDKSADLWRQIRHARITPNTLPVEIALAPVEQDVRKTVMEYWITPDWEFFGLHSYLET